MTTSLEFDFSSKVQQQIELFISCKDLNINSFLKRYYPSVALYIERDGIDQFDSRTEYQKKNTANPTFLHSFAIDYIVCNKQKLKFIVSITSSTGNEKVLGVVYTTLDSLIERKEPTSQFDILKEGGNNHSSRGKLVLQRDYISATSNIAQMFVQLDNLSCSKGFFKKEFRGLSFQLLKQIGNSEHYIPVFDSCLHKYQSLEWYGLRIALQKLCNRDYEKSIRIHVMEKATSSKPSIIGEACFTINDLLDNTRTNYTTALTCPKTKKTISKLIIHNFELIETPHYLDFINAGLRFNLLMGIDYTISNGDPQNPESLHSLNQGGPNEYEKAIKGILGSFQNCHLTKNVQMFGFGGRQGSLKSASTSHCFSLPSVSNREQAVDVDAVLKVYRESLGTVEMGSPSYLESLIREGKNTAQAIESSGRNEYVVLIILTDGKCHDMQDTISEIVESSRFPLSVVIAGLGESNFSKMEILESHALHDNNGNRSERDIVQFIQFRDFRDKSLLLGKTVMQEISEQMLQYMYIKGILPETIRQRQYRNDSEKPKIMTPKTDSRFNVEEDLCEEDKNKNFSSFFENQVDMKNAFFKTFAKITETNPTDFSNEDSFISDERNQSISSFYSSQGNMRPTFLKCLNSTSVKFSQSRSLKPATDGTTWDSECF